MQGRSTLLSLFFFILFYPAGWNQSLIINHQDVNAFDSIPEKYKEAAANLRMLFMDRSVGGNISFYLDCLSHPWSSAPSACKRYQHQDSIYDVDASEVQWNRVWDRSQWRYEYWPTGCSEDVNCFIDYMDDRIDSFDVMGCQFSYLAVLPGSTIADPETGFFGMSGNNNKASIYSAFGAAYPGKKLIWWTTSLARGIGTPESESFNQQMRDYAADHDIILFDVADILSHDPDGNACFDNRDGVAYKDENYPDDSLSIPAICPQYTTETEGGHLGSISAGGIRVSKAFWVLMARIAGWQGITSSVESPADQTTILFPNPTKQSIYLQFNISSTDESIECMVFDLWGKIHLRQSVNPAISGDQVVSMIPVYTLTPGIYFLQVRIGSKIETHKMVVQ